MLKLIKMDHETGFFRKLFYKVYLWATERLYHSFAWAYDFVAWLVSFGNWSRWRLDILDYLQPGCTLEVGFGTGSLLIEMAQRGYEVMGLELSPQMHQVTQRKLERKGLTFPRIRGRTEGIPFASKVFDNVISSFPSDYIVHEDTLDEILRVLRLGGRLVIVGVGVRFKSPFKRWLTGWLIGETSDELIQGLKLKAEAAGFRVRIQHHETDRYTMPVLILERRDAR